MVDRSNVADDVIPAHDVVVIGAGASGLMAARILLLHKRSIVVLEARRRKGGRSFSFPMPESGSHKITTIVKSPIAEEAPLNTRVD